MRHISAYLFWYGIQAHWILNVQFSRFDVLHNVLSDFLGNKRKLKAAEHSTLINNIRREWIWTDICQINLSQLSSFQMIDSPQVIDSLNMNNMILRWRPIKHSKLKCLIMLWQQSINITTTTFDAWRELNWFGYKRNTVQTSKFTSKFT